ncbi:MAG: gene transfer agent family protein [Neomegalonema sp.]|nr:gene transfer agent family protein [Neomegalonema sp.]
MPEPPHSAPNPARGQICHQINGQARALRLTLASLAELEATLPGETLFDLVARLEAGTPKAGDILALLSAGLRGAGSPMSPDELASAEIEGGLPAAYRLAADLLHAAFPPKT